LTREDAVEQAYREHAFRLLALLTRELRRLDQAEDALQDAHVAALAQWTDGVPANPAGWLLTVARRRALERLRREATLARKLPLLVIDAADQPTLQDEEEIVISDEPAAAGLHRLPSSLSRPAQVALTLRFVGGLTTREIARLFVVAEPMMAARITRAKRKIAERASHTASPRESELPERLASVLAVVYLIFTEGYFPTEGQTASATRALRGGDPPRSDAPRADARRV
jgi:RNA polymerase sigma-70 factor (ECF subfamily)